MALPGILKKPIKAYQAHQNNLKIKREALTNADSLVSALKFLKPGCDLNLKSSGLGSGKRSWVDKYLHPQGGKAGAADGLRTFAELHEKYDKHPIAKQAARALTESLPKKREDNQTVRYDKKLYELAKRIANPQQYEHELKVETPAPTGVAIAPTVDQAPTSETSAADAQDAEEQKLLAKHALLKQSDFQAALDHLPDFARVKTAVEALKAQAIAYQMANNQEITAKEAATYLIKALAPFDSADHVSALGDLLNNSPLLGLVHEPVAKALIEHYLVSRNEAANADAAVASELDMAWSQLHATVNQLGDDLDR